MNTTSMRVLAVLAAVSVAFLLVVALTTKSSLHVDRVAEAFSGSRSEGSRLIRQAFAYAHEGMTEEAIAAFDRARELAPTDPLPYARLAGLYTQRGEYARALAELDLADRAGLAHVELHMARSLVYQKMERWDDAQHILELACDRFPEEPDPWRSLGWILLKRDRPAQALPHLLEAARLAPDEPYHRVLLARAYAAAGRLEEARREMEEAHRLDPDDLGALMQTGWMCAREGQLEDAVRYFSEALRRRPDSSEPRLALGLMHERLGDSVEALQCLREAARVCPEEASVHRALGRAYERRGMHSEAARSYEWALDLGGPDREIVARLVSMYLVLGDPARASSVAVRATREAPQDEELAELAASLSAGQ